MILITFAGNDTIWITVKDTTFPEISSTNTVIYKLGDTGNTISWTTTDLEPATYTVYLNGSFYTTGSWISGNTFLVDIDGLAIGLYNFTVVCGDTSGNSNSNIVLITVEETALTHEETTEETISGFNF